MQEFGWTNPILISEDNLIIAEVKECFQGLRVPDPDEFVYNFCNKYTMFKGSVVKESLEKLSERGWKWNQNSNQCQNGVRNATNSYLSTVCSREKPSVRIAGHNSELSMYCDEEWNLSREGMHEQTKTYKMELELQTLKGCKINGNGRHDTARNCKRV